MYHWIIANNSTGAIGTGSGTHSQDKSLAPTGYTFVGPYDDSNNPMPADFKAAFDSPQAYLYQNGAFVTNPNYDANAVELAQAKQAQLGSLAQGFAEAVASGFASSADGTSRIYSIDQTAMTKWTGILSLINAGSGPTSISLKTLDGTKVSMTQEQFKQMATDGFTYFNTQEENLWSKEDDVNNATTIADVQAVTWS